MSVKREYLIVFSAIILIAAFAFFLHARLFGKVPDVDAFYHLKHAFLYKTAGIFQSAFPWTQYSVINQYSSDIWYGFHILLIPLTFFINLASGLTIGGYFVTVASLLLAFFAFKKLEVKWPVFWTFVFAFASADFLYRLTMLRPHPLSLGIALLLFAYLQNKKGPLVIIGILSFAFSWIHLSLTWLPVLILLAVLLFEILQKEGVSWQKALAVFAGLTAGWLARPNPLGAAKIAYIQVAKLLVEKQGDLPLRFGRELLPFYWENFVDQLIPIVGLILIAGAILFFLRSRLKEEVRPAILGSLSLAVIFFALTFGVARRSTEIFVGFGVIFLALIFTHLWPLISKNPLPRNLALLVSVVALVAMPLKNLYRFDTYAANAFSVERFQEISNWLLKNSKPGELVFNIHWDRFAELFFYNHGNYYMNGMDPIFEYAFRPELYWKTHFFAIDAASAFTCGMIKCTAEEVESTPKVLKNDFKASYLMVEKRRSPKFYQYLSGVREFRKVFETDSDALFKIL